MYSNPDTDTGGPELGFFRCFADGLNPEFSSICGKAIIEGVGLVLH